MVESYSVVDAGIVEHGVEFVRDGWELDGPEWLLRGIASAGE